MKGYSEHVCACTCGTHSLEALEEAIEEEVPDDFAILKGRNVPYEEVGNHSQRGWQYDPADEIKQEEGGGRGVEQENMTTATASVGVKRDLFKVWNISFCKQFPGLKSLSLRNYSWLFYSARANTSSVILHFS